MRGGDCAGGKGGGSEHCDGGFGVEVALEGKMALRETCRVIIDRLLTEVSV